MLAEARTPLFVQVSYNPVAVVQAPRGERRLRAHITILLQRSECQLYLAEFITTNDPRPNEFGELCALVLIAKVAAVFEDG